MVPSPAVETLDIACDFDGTITRVDTLHLIVEAFGAEGAWTAIEPRLLSGELSLEEAMQEQFAQVYATPDEVAALVLERAGLRSGFGEFEAWCRARGHRLVVLSSGFRTVIARLLHHWGFAHLELTSHEAEFSAQGARLIWSDRGPACPECGRRCKRHDLRRLGLGHPLVYIGDGISDRCAAQVADLVFARADLARHLTTESVPFVPFEDFSQVLARLQRPVGMAA